ncbi:peroxiredoxin [Sphingomonas jejuensis]|uniref:thioredoxin-dependent peroxiredoxin n=1 Tax=Sphingomonas jejuensis TaxID=904715 RepID=A0ABX0XQ52_9SPHN|nr:peroxiredoxin [Sphingomonas jejuensis]NJC34821.1 peroxiredoxin [Sphingomonas jejuensis]
MRLALLAAAAACLMPATAANAALPIGARAPEIRTQGALAGRPFRFNLAAALRRGPVVLYFYPAAFTQGCTIEANAFAEATDEFRRAGATVIGMSADDLPTLTRFSREECRDRFAVATAPAATIRAYDAALGDGSRANRISYVIGQDGRVVLAHEDRNPRTHITQTLAAVQRLADARR